MRKQYKKVTAAANRSASITRKCKDLKSTRGNPNELPIPTAIVATRTELWITEYNEERPHDSQDDMTPLEFMVTSKPDYSSLQCT